jgi:hypothetical protein
MMLSPLSGRGARGRARYTVSRVKLSELASHFGVAGSASAGGGGGGGSAADRQQRLAECVQAAIREGRGVDQRFDALKGGAPLAAEWLHWASVRAPQQGSDGTHGGGGDSAHMRRHHRCAACGASLIVSADELRRHAQSEECRRAAAGHLGYLESAAQSGTAARPRTEERAEEAPPPRGQPGQEPPAAAADDSSLEPNPPVPAPAEAPASTSALGKRTAYDCATCGKCFLFTQLDVMRHQATHRAAGDE